MRSEYQAAYYAANGDRMRAMSNAYNARIRDMTRAAATRNGAAWTSDDDALLLEDDGRRMWEKALTLGRTARACYERRRRLLRGMATPAAA